MSTTCRQKSTLELSEFCTSKKRIFHNLEYFYIYIYRDHFHLDLYTLKYKLKGILQCSKFIVKSIEELFL